ncbi:hypothetical protein V8E36_008714 [Tilletia maclaganii]
MPPPAAHAARYPRAQFTSSGAGGGASGSHQSRGLERGTDEPETKRGRKPFSHRGIFARDVRALLYAYGDVPDPDPDTVNLVEELAVDFLTDLCHRARPSPYALPQAPGIRALVPATDQPGTSGVASGAASGTELHPAQISAIAAGANSLATTGPASTQVYMPLPPSAAGHPYYTRARIKVDDLKHALRKDGKKYARVEELLYLDKVISAARKQVDVTEAAAALVATTSGAPSASAGTGAGAG